MTTITLSKVEAPCVLRHLRAAREAISRDMVALEERRLRGGYDGKLDGAHRALDAEATILDDVIRRLWDMVGPVPGPG